MAPDSECTGSLRGLLEAFLHYLPEPWSECVESGTQDDYEDITDIVTESQMNIDCCLVKFRTNQWFLDAFD